MCTVISNNSIRLRQLQHHIPDNTTFSNINGVSLSALDRLLKSDSYEAARMKQLRYEYVEVSYTILSLVLYSSGLCYMLTALSIHTVIQ